VKQGGGSGEIFPARVAGANTAGRGRGRKQKVEKATIPGPRTISNRNRITLRLAHNGRVTAQTKG
jgi:hypothetical protein